MKFQFTGTSSYTDIHTDVNFEGKNWAKKDISHIAIVKPKILESHPNDIQKRLRLKLIWKHSVLFKGSHLYTFDSERVYFITAPEEAPTIENLEDIVKESYKDLQEAFAKRTKDLNVFDPVPEIDENTIQKTVGQLSLFLSPEKQQ
jgi:hypothetical protein